ncbi:hypothetical protein T492DRAFT_201008 [Pavlovales sp. CCMP2436]|nr:hypothetical protein T492DRAFT_201008 [Pavlovales sp. CCMP2436]
MPAAFPQMMALCICGLGRPIPHRTPTRLPASKARATVALSFGAVGSESVDVVVIGAGVGGLSCAAMLARYGLDVLVLESHSIAGGAAHGFERGGFKFDSGPSLFNGMSEPSTNPLRQVQRSLLSRGVCVCGSSDGGGEGS